MDRKETDRLVKEWEEACANSIDCGNPEVAKHVAKCANAYYPMREALEKISVMANDGCGGYERKYLSAILMEAKQALAGGVGE